jgi:hypothetical protein
MGSQENIEWWGVKNYKIERCKSVNVFYN